MQQVQIWSVPQHGLEDGADGIANRVPQLAKPSSYSKKTLQNSGHIKRLVAIILAGKIVPCVIWMVKCYEY